MTPDHLLNEIKSAVKQVQDEGIESISAQSLQKYLSELEHQVSASNSEPQLESQESFLLAQYRANHESTIEHYKAINASNLEHFKTVISSGQTALKSAILINGGGSVALLTFIGKIISNGPIMNHASELPLSLFCFVLGVLSAAVASGATYLAQSSFQTKKNVGHIFNGTAIALVLFSYFLFFKGAFVAFSAFEKIIST